MVVEFHMPETAHFALQGIYYVFAVITLLRLEEIEINATLCAESSCLGARANRGWLPI